MTKEQSLEIAEPKSLSLGQMKEYAGVFYASGYFKDQKSLSQGIVKIMAGQELGLAPFTAMKGINIIDGKPELSAGLMGSLIKNSGKYDYRVKDWDSKGCTVTITQEGKEVGSATFNTEDATTAGLINKNNWKSHPKAMYFARALSMAARTYCPEVLGGGSVYVEGELSGETSEAEVVTAPETVKDDVVEEEATSDDAVEEEEPVFPEDELSDKELQSQVADKMNYLELNKAGMMRLNNTVFGSPIAPSPMNRGHWEALEVEIDEMIAKKEAEDESDAND